MSGHVVVNYKIGTYKKNIIDGFDSWRVSKRCTLGNDVQLQIYLKVTLSIFNA